MLLLTDRLNEGLRLKQVLAPIGVCSVVPLHQAMAHSSTGGIIICDVAFENITAMELLRAALSRHRATSEVPLLCLTRDPSVLTRTQAYAMGATAVLPYHTPPASLLAAVKTLSVPDLDAAKQSRKEDRDIRGSVRDTGEALSELVGAVRRRSPISLATLDRGSNVVLAAIEQAKIRSWLDVVWKYDDMTYQHCLLVAGLAAAFALELGLSRKHQRLVSQAALVHDIGKAQIPHEILQKKSGLTAAEMKVMRTHATIGHGMLIDQPGLDPRLLNVVLHHHEYLDGSGYPDGLKDHQISRFVRLVTICDIYAALIERRSYKSQLSPQKALSMLSEMGAKLDAGLLKAFEGVVGGI